MKIVGGQTGFGKPEASASMPAMRYIRPLSSAREYEARKAKRWCVWDLDCSSPGPMRRSLTNGKSSKCLFQNEIPGLEKS
jgi:hypothetical protein